MGVQEGEPNRYLARLRHHQNGRRGLEIYRGVHFRDGGRRLSSSHCEEESDGGKHDGQLRLYRSRGGRGDHDAGFLTLGCRNDRVHCGL